MFPTLGTSDTLDNVGFAFVVEVMRMVSPVKLELTATAFMH
jgi:hypothetical protein